MFNGTCNGVNMQKASIKDRYHGVTWSSIWGSSGVKSIFDTIDNLNPGDEIDYITWQKLIYANKLLAQKYNLYYWEFLLENHIFPEWNEKTEDWDYKHMKFDNKGNYIWEYVKVEIDEKNDKCHITPIKIDKEPKL